MEVSLQRQRWGIGVDRISPRGKTLGEGNHAFYQNGHQDFTLEPGVGALRIAFLEMTERQQRFEPLEGEFHLPPPAIQFEDGTRRDVVVERREDEDVGGRFQRFRSNLAVLLARFAYCLVAAALRRRLAFLDRANAARNSWRGVVPGK